MSPRAAPPLLDPADDVADSPICPCCYSDDDHEPQPDRGENWWECCDCGCIWDEDAAAANDGGEEE